jgi:hypothetical protein
MQIVAACLAVGDRLPVRIYVFMTNHAVAFDLSPALLEAILEISGSRAE